MSPGEARSAVGFAAPRCLVLGVVVVSVTLTLLFVARFSCGGILRGSPTAHPRGAGGLAAAVGSLDRRYFALPGVAFGAAVPTRAVQLRGKTWALHERSSVSRESFEGLTQEIDSYFAALQRLNIALTDQLILDVGAHVGAFAATVAEACPSCTIVALEPSPATFFMLQANVAALPNVIALNFGLGATSGVRSFADVPERSMVGSMVDGAPMTESQPRTFVRVVSYDDLLRLLDLAPRAGQSAAGSAAGGSHADFDILKIDCEGCEYETYEEAFWRTPRQAILADTHDWGSTLPADTSEKEAELRRLPWVVLT